MSRSDRFYKTNFLEHLSEQEPERPEVSWARLD